MLDEDWSLWQGSQSARNMMMSSRHPASRAIWFSDRTQGAHVIPALFSLIALRTVAEESGEEEWLRGSDGALVPPAISALSVT